MIMICPYNRKRETQVSWTQSNDDGENINLQQIETTTFSFYPDTMII